MRITNLGVCVLVALGAFSTGCVTQPARGLLVRLYDIGVDVASVPELASASVSASGPPSLSALGSRWARSYTQRTVSSGLPA